MYLRKSLAVALLGQQTGTLVWDVQQAGTAQKKWDVMTHA
jgi:hypothetical protein